MGPPGPVGPNLILTGDLTVNGNTILGDTPGACTDTLTVDAAATFACAVTMGDTLDVDGSTTLGTGGTPILKHLSATASLDFDFSGAGITAQDLTIAVAGAAIGDTVVVGVPNSCVETGNVFVAWVSAAGTVTVRGIDVDSAGTNIGSDTFRVDVWQH